MNRIAAAVAALASFAMLAQAPAHGQPAGPGDVARIGVLTDMSGTYSDFTGQGSVEAARMALEDFGAAQLLGRKLEIVSADHLNKADVAAERARSWYDQDKVEVIVDLVATNVALAVMEVAEKKNKITLNSGAASLPITNERCTATNVHWVYDTYALSVGTTRTVVNAGKKNWYFVAVDYAFGAAMVKEASEVVKANGGTVVGIGKHPLSAGDFSSVLLSAQSARPDVIALANGGQDTINSIKQAVEFGLTGKHTVLPMVMFINDVHALGLKTAQGLMLTEGFYWNRDEKTRAWSRRFFSRTKKMPSMVHAGVYSSVSNYLKAVKQAGSFDAQKVMAVLKSTTIDDGLFKGTIREDGKFVHDMLLMEVKKPSESTEPWDYYHIRAVIPGKEAALPLERSQCKLVRRQ